MKNYFLLFLGLTALCSFVPVKKKNKTAKTNSTNNTQLKQAQDYLYTDSAYWYKISFISTGGGTDIKAINACKQFVKDFEKQNKVQIKYKVAPWGREGEQDYCFAVNQLTAKQAKLFREKSKEILVSYVLVRYKDICKCDKYREIIPETE